MFYSEHKYCHEYKMQKIITPDSLLSLVWDPIVGSRGDWYVFEQSKIEEKIKKLFEKAGILEDEQLYLYEDSAYTGSAAIMEAYQKSCEQ